MTEDEIRQDERSRIAAWLLEKARFKYEQYKIDAETKHGIEYAAWLVETKYTTNKDQQS